MPHLRGLFIGTIDRQRTVDNSQYDTNLFVTSMYMKGQLQINYREMLLAASTIGPNQVAVKVPMDVAIKLLGIHYDNASDIGPRPPINAINLCSYVKNMCDILPKIDCGLLEFICIPNTTWGPRTIGEKSIKIDLFNELNDKENYANGYIYLELFVIAKDETHSLNDILNSKKVGIKERAMLEAKRMKGSAPPVIVNTPPVIVSTPPVIVTTPPVVVTAPSSTVTTMQPPPVPLNRA